MKTFGQRLKELRVVNGCTQKRFESLTGLPREYVSKLENDHLKNPTINLVKKIARAFNMTISQFLDGVLED